jgi:hypothetical protein
MFELMNPPPGCRLEPRCPIRVERCKTDDDIPYKISFDLNPGGNNFISVVAKLEKAGDDREFIVKIRGRKIF